MTQFLPPNLLALFAARDPIPYLPPASKLSHEKQSSGYTGIGTFVKNFEDPKDTPPVPKIETKDERKERKRREKAEQIAYKLEQEIAVWNPNGIPSSTTDPFRTLFVARINFDTSESKLRREFEAYGNVKKIIMVTNKKSGKPRGYAFVEYEHERDMHSAYKHADGKKIDGRRVLVDVERGRTVKGWLPRRLGGGLGGTRRGGPDVNVKISGREDPDRDRFSDEKSDRRRGGDRDRGDSRDYRRERERSRDRNDSDRDRRVERDRGDRDRGEKHREKEKRRSSRDRDRSERSERKRRRSRSRDKKDKDRDKENPEEGEERPRKRSRSREKKRHRSKSRDKEKKREKRDKERDRDKDRDRGDRKDKDRERIKPDPLDLNNIRVKEEPQDDYPTFDNYPFGGYIKKENNNNIDGDDDDDDEDDM